MVEVRRCDPNEECQGTEMEMGMYVNLLNSQTAIGVVRELLLSFEREVQRKLEWVYGTQSCLDLWG